VKNVVHGLCDRFKCILIGFRGEGGFPITAGKAYCIASWEDIVEPVDYIKKTYGQDRRLHLYGCSLGATLCCHYLAKTKNPPVESCALYGTIFDTMKTQAYARESCLGLINHGIGYALKEKLRL